MYHYCAYGLSIASNILLPELIPAGAAAIPAPDVLLHVRASHESVEDSHAHTMPGRRGPDDACLDLPGVGMFWIRDGHEIVAEPDPSVTDQALRLFLLGPALAMILHQRGNLVLHASAVNLAPGREQGVVAFLGDSRAGKSTMAAALCARGHRAVADDILAIPASFLSGSPAKARPQISVYPGFPVLKLWPEASTSVYGATGDAKSALQIAPHNPRRVRHVNHGFSLVPQPLLRLYVLAEGESIRAEPLEPGAAMLALLQHSFWVSQLPREQNIRHFQQCSMLVKRLPLYRLERPRDLDMVDRVAQAIEQDVACVSA